jgi:hypothetical protein
VYHAESFERVESHAFHDVHVSSVHCVSLQCRRRKAYVGCSDGYVNFYTMR